jgi:predicted porin
MKKSLIALAVLAAAGTASAQSSVTLFGIVDATLTYGKTGGTGGTHRWGLGSGGYNTSRLGFRGTEDLGGGMSASFWLEAQMSVDTGVGSATNTNNQASGTAVAGGAQGLTFNRRSTVSLSGNWGEVRLGRDYTPQFWNINIFDPFGVNGVGTTLLFPATSGGAGIVNGNASTSIRASNSIGYFLPGNLGGFYGQAMYHMGENPRSGAASQNDGNGYGIRLGFATGPFNVAAAFSRTRYSTGDVRQDNLGGQWDLGMARLMGQYQRDRVGTVSARGWLLGALVPVGPGEIRVAYSRYTTDQPIGTDPRANKLALGYVHNLSKRTAVYATWAHVSNNSTSNVVLNGSTGGAGGTSNGFDLGLRHAF